MKFERIDPPRTFKVGLDRSVEISDCGRVYLGPDEQVTFVSPSGKEYDFAAKSWGFYVTPSVNGRLKRQGFKTALVKNSFAQYYVMVVDPACMDEFNDYLSVEKQVVVEWLDEK